MLKTNLENLEKLGLGENPILIFQTLYSKRKHILKIGTVGKLYVIVLFLTCQNKLKRHCR